MAGQDASLLGMGGMSQPSLVASPGTMGRTINAPGGPPTHYSILVLVFLAVAGLWALDKFGFRFAVTAGRR